MTTALETYLNQFFESDWLGALDSLSSGIHRVDRNATQIWFRFFPLKFRRFIENEHDEADLRRSLGLLGDFDLADQIDSSHRFLYGHRYWKTVKAAIEAEAEVFTDENPKLADEIKQVAANIAEKLKVDASLILGVTAVGFMTLNQIGLDAFRAAAGEVEKPTGIMAKSPDAIVSERKRNDSQGLLGFLRTVDKKFTVTYIDKFDSGKFQVMNEEEIASASARDQSKNWRERDERCWEGVVPVECRSASCGTCWIGILAGEEKLSEVGRRERRMMKIFGYNQPEDEKPILRLACQAKAYGNATIAIPTWNGVFGKKIYGNIEELELEPVTTSAQKLRETIASATSGDENIC
jgi:ferredoxin